jgi:transcription elongation factor GreB
MSKAFAGESEDEGEIPAGPPLPEGVRNYMTASGADRLRERVRLLSEERRRFGEGVEGQAHAQKTERQLRYWLPRLESLEAVDPLTQPQDRALFGASVTVADDKGEKTVWRIVGIDESDLGKGWISWMSPLASALLDKRAGESLSFMGRRLTIMQIAYESD